MENKNTIEKQNQDVLDQIDMDGMPLDEDMSIDGESINVVRREKIVARKILTGFKKFWIWVVISTLIGLMGGLIYFNNMEAYYTVTQKVIFTASPIKDGNSPYSSGVTEQYLPTMVDFIDEGVVMDRASRYYHVYAEGRNQTTYKTLDDFFLAFEQGMVDISNVEPDGSISSEYVKASNASEKDFTINVSYSGYDENSIKDKVRMVIFAAEQEALSTVVAIENGKVENKYFGVYVRLDDYGIIGGPSSNLNKSRTMTIACLIGFAVGCAGIIIYSILDSRIKDKEELELITGTNLIAYIDAQ